MWRVKSLLFLVIVAIVGLGVCGCGIEQYEQHKSDVLSIDEYNQTVARYNKLVLAFTRLARLAEKNTGRQHDLDKKFWEKLESRKQEVFLYADQMEHGCLQDESLGDISHKIELLISKIQEYISTLETYKSDVRYIPGQDLADMNKILYNEMLQLSSEIVCDFDNVYRQMVTK